MTTTDLGLLGARRAYITARHEGSLATITSQRAAGEISDEQASAAIAEAEAKYRAAFDRWDRDMDRFTADLTRRSDMGKHDDALKAAKAALNDRLVTALNQRQALDADLAIGKITEQYAQHERQRITTEVALADGKASDLLKAYVDGALADARALRLLRDRLDAPYAAATSTGVPVPCSSPCA